MTDFGTIRSYNSARGAGTILPEEGGDALPFRKADMQDQGQDPQLEARFSYITQKGDGGFRRAVNLCAQEEEGEGPSFEDRQNDQARQQRG